MNHIFEVHIALHNFFDSLSTILIDHLFLTSCLDRQSGKSSYVAIDIDENARESSCSLWYLYLVLGLGTQFLISWLELDFLNVSSF